MDAYDDIDSELLHIPSRSGTPETLLEEHLDKANALARAMWLATDSVALDGIDARDKAALRALAGELAEEVSLALLNLNRSQRSKKRPALIEEPQESA